MYLSFSNLAGYNDHHSCQKNLKPCLEKPLHSSLEENMAKPLWKDKIKEKNMRSRGSTGWCLWAVYTIPVGSSRAMKRFNGRWRTMGLPTQERLNSSRVYKGLSAPQPSSSNGQGCWRYDRQGVKVAGRGLWLFIKESDNKLFTRGRVALNNDVHHSRKLHTFEL